MESLVPEEYHDLLQTFEKGEKTGLPPHRPGIDLEINIEEGKGLPDQKIYPLGAEELETVQEYIKKNQARGWIREALTNGGSPIMFVKKKDGSLRLCVDYRALNEVTKKDRYPLPLICEALDRLHTAKYFTKLDIKEAYHNVRIKKGDEWKTTFTSKYGTYEYLVMPFGLCNAPATFQSWINRTLQCFIDRCCIVYLDNVLIYSDNLEQHKRDVRNIINAIYQSGMRLKPSKCEFHQTETEYLGFIVSQEGIKVDPIKTKAIRTWKPPTKKKEIQSFLGFCNFYRRFIEGFSKVAKPLYKLAEKDQKWEFGTKQQGAFDEQIHKLTHAPILAHYDPKKPITIETDASKYVTAGIISQTGDNGIVRPIAYRSKSMSKSECNYDVHDNELLAIILALEDW